MTHNEERSHWIREGLLSTGAGVLYGVSCVVVGHPLDTIKTKMQAQKGFEKISMTKSFIQVLTTQGLRGLYRGAIPPMIGSGIYRSLQFSSFEAVYTYYEGSWACAVVPFFPGGLQYRVLIASAAASLTRAVIETPMDYVKIRRQTGQSWKFFEIYKGFPITIMRTWGLMTTFFVVLDYGRRNHKELFSRPLLGPFLVAGCAGTCAWWVIWPLELVKAQVQANYGVDKASLAKRFSLIVQEGGGFSALYRGLMPGSLRSLLANGIGFIVLTFVQKKITELGLRG